MKIKLDPMQGYVKDGKFDLKSALESIGVKAAVCFKEQKNGLISQEDIRTNEDSATLITRGVNTILSDHTTPSEHQVVSLEITGIPKRLCMVLNNEKFYTADERSLRYTEVEPNEYITDREVKLYRKWLNIIETSITLKYWDFYRRFAKSDKACLNTIHKLAQENARYMVSVNMPTVMTYTVPLAQINKIALYMERVIQDPKSKFEQDCIPYFKEFIAKLKDLHVLITKKDIYKLAQENPALEEKLTKCIPNFASYCDNEEMLYRNNKQIELSLFANRNPLSPIKEKNMVNCSSISYTNLESIACLAQDQRHRTNNIAMEETNIFYGYVPNIIKDDHATKEWIEDLKSVQDITPQGAMVKVNHQIPLSNLFNFVAKERACERAQLEIEELYVNEIIPFVYKELINQGNVEMAKKIRPYLGNLRCKYPDYNCPTPCGHPRARRKL